MCVCVCVSVFLLDLFVATQRFFNGIFCSYFLYESNEKRKESRTHFISDDVCACVCFEHLIWVQKSPKAKPEVFEGGTREREGDRGERTLLSTNKLATLLPFHRVDSPAGMGRGWLEECALKQGVCLLNYITMQ